MVAGNACGLRLWPRLRPKVAGTVGASADGLSMRRSDHLSLQRSLQLTVHPTLHLTLSLTSHLSQRPKFAV